MIREIKTANHDEWLEVRRKHIGGSDASAVIGMNHFRSAYTLWAEKTGRIEEFTGNLATEMGAFLEEFVAKKFTETTGKKVRRKNATLVNDLYPFASANIDREVVGEDAGLECKTTSEINIRRFNGIDFPEQYYCQCVHYMAVTGKKRWYLAVLIGNRDFQVYCLERDQAEIDALMNAERSFWYDHVLTGAAPDPDGSSSSSDTIEEMYPDEEPEYEVDVTPYISDLRRRSEIKERIGKLTDELVEIENRVKDYMGNASTASADGYRITWRSSTRATIDTKKLFDENPDIDRRQYEKITKSRTFRVKEEF